MYSYALVRFRKFRREHHAVVSGDAVFAPQPFVRNAPQGSEGNSARFPCVHSFGKPEFDQKFALPSIRTVWPDRKRALHEVSSRFVQRYDHRGFVASWFDQKKNCPQPCGAAPPFRRVRPGCFFAAKCTAFFSDDPGCRPVFFRIRRRGHGGNSPVGVACGNNGCRMN